MKMNSDTFSTTIVLAVTMAITIVACRPATNEDEQSVSTRSDLVGSWSLVETKAYTSDGKLNYAPEVRAGIFTFGESTYSLMWTREPRPDPASHWSATADERLVSFGTMIAHAGGYERAADSIILHARTAKSPEFEGGHETFQFSVSDDTLRMTATAAESRTGVQVPFYEASGWQDYLLVRID